MDVTVGINTDEYVTSHTLVSLTKMFNAYPEDFQSRLIVVEGGCGDFAGGRNRLVREFLSTGVEWLLVVDSDMVWQPEDWRILRDSADEAERPWVSGTYFVDNEVIRPCCMNYHEDGSATIPILSDESTELVQVSAACVGFGLIHRDVFYKTGDFENDHEWFEHGWRSPQGGTLSEDYAFCSRAGEAGIPIYINTKVRVGHVKRKILTWDDYRRQRQEVERADALLAEETGD